MYPIVIFIVIAASSGTPTGSRRRSTLNHRPGIVYRDPLIATASFPLVGEKDYSSRCPERHLMALHKFRELSVAKCNDGSPAGYASKLHVPIQWFDIGNLRLRNVITLAGLMPTKVSATALY